jgi:hypothetical protein
VNATPEFPNLSSTNHRPTSQRDPSYNCFAWAAHYTDRWLEAERLYAYWPDDVPRRLTVNNLTAVYAKEGFERCQSADHEPGYEKIAIYADRRGLPLHAARQLDNGMWTSKMGEFEDIEHETIAVVEGRGYGNAVRYLRRLKTN